MKRYLLTILLTLLASIWLSWGESRLDFPRASLEADRITGIAIINPNEDDAQITLTLLTDSGVAVDVEENPVVRTVGAGEQFAITLGELFPRQPPSPDPFRLRVTSPANDLTGFFLYLDPTVRLFDGADLSPQADALYFPVVQIEGGRTTEINLLNSASHEVQVQLVLRNGSAFSEKELLLPGDGVARLDVGHFFGDDVPCVPQQPCYLEASGEKPIAGFEFVRTGEDLLGLNAYPADEPLTKLYFPQFALGGGIVSHLTLINHSESSEIATLRAFTPSGDLHTPAGGSNPVTLALSPRGIARPELGVLFGFEGDELREGWLEVEATSRTLGGALTYEIEASGSIAAVTPLRQGLGRAVFSHLATSLGFFTGVAALNTGTLAADLDMVALDGSGKILGQSRTTLPPGNRVSRLITELIPEAADQAGGLIWLRSSTPLYLTSLFGSAENGVLANVPPQPIPESYSPQGDLTELEVDPKLAVIQPGTTQDFALRGTGDTPIWTVNSVPGGNSEIGTISSTGLYKSPEIIPPDLPISIVADLERQSAGATVDVLSRNELLGELGLVQSIAFLEGSQRLYSAELTSTTSGSAGQPAQSSAPTSIVRDITDDSGEVVAELGGEEVPKIVPFTNSEGQELLLLAAATSGRILQLNPFSGEILTLIDGLNEPRTLVIDWVEREILVAEADQVSAYAIDDLTTPTQERGAQQISRGSPKKLLASPQARVAVNQCNGNVYVSDPQEGRILELVRLTGAVRSVAQGLADPGQLLGFYRLGVPCPDSFHLIVAEGGMGRLTIVIPSYGSVRPWVDASHATDLIFVPSRNPVVPGSAVLLSELVGEEGRLSAVSLPDLYIWRSVDPPGRKPTAPCNLTQLTDSSKDVLEATLDPGGGSVAWISEGDPVGSNSDGSPEIFLRSREMKQPIQLTDNLGSMKSLSLDLGGRRMVFSAKTESVGASPRSLTYLWEKSTGEIQAISGSPATNPALDWQGRYVVYQSRSDPLKKNYDRNEEIFLFDTETKETTQVSVSEQGSNQWPAISGDGNWVVFFSDSDLDAKNPMGYLALYLYSRGADEIRKVAFVAEDPSKVAEFLQPAVLNYDGSKLFFDTNRNLTGENPLRNRVSFLFERGSGELTQISRLNADSSVSGSSRDGDRVGLISTADPLGLNPDNNRELFFLNPATAEIRQVTRSRNVRHFGVSVDGTGRQMIFLSTYDYGGKNADGSTEAFLADCNQNR